MKEYPIAFVCLLGIGIVFLGLVCIILLCMVISAICGKVTNKQETSPAAPAQPTVVNQPALIPNRKKIIAAVSAVIAEELGTDVSAIRIKSFKKI